MPSEQQIAEFRQELQTLINKYKFCWVCGREDILTEHHAIPEKIRGVIMNVKIPVCYNCKDVIHLNDVLSAIVKRMFLR